MASAPPRYSDTLLEPESRVEAVRRWESERLVERLWDRDPSVWGGAAPSADRWLGWLDLAETMLSGMGPITRLTREVLSEGVEDVVLMGMGGSSLAPEMFFSVFGSAPGHPRLSVIDSTHPEAVERLGRRIDPSRTLFLVSSKSGTTVETLSLYRHFWEESARHGQRFAAITDRGTPLDSLARERGFRAVFNPPADVGGRFSAFTSFGLVPAALIGVDIAALAAGAQEMAEKGRCDPPDNPAVAMGIALGAGALAGMDKLTLRTSPSLASFAFWMEQLVAESLGKGGVGIIPVAGEPILPAGSYGPDRMMAVWEVAGDPPVPPAGDGDMRVEMAALMDLGAELFRAELAVAAAGEVLGVNPFDQPDVEEAKRLASQAMGRSGEAVASDLVPARSPDAKNAIGNLVANLESGQYLGIQAYLPADPSIDLSIAKIRRRVGEASGVATTFGYGPRYLHSTGQVHKGGPPSGVFLQIVDRPRLDVEVPGAGYGFSRLISAQAEGDYRALLAKNRRVVRIDLGSDRLGGLHAIGEALA